MVTTPEHFVKYHEIFEFLIMEKGLYAHVMFGWKMSKKQKCQVRWIKQKAINLERQRKNNNINLDNDISRRYINTCK